MKFIVNVEYSNETNTGIYINYNDGTIISTQYPPNDKFKETFKDIMIYITENGINPYIPKPVDEVVVKLNEYIKYLNSIRFIGELKHNLTGEVATMTEFIKQLDILYNRQND